MISQWSPLSWPQTGTLRMMLKPGVSVGTMICVILSFTPPAASCSSVRHMTMAKCARRAFDENHLCPLITHSFPSRTARVWIA
jgi:hypothetical protein